MDAELHALMKDVNRLVGSLGAGEPRQASKADGVALALFDRCRGLFTAVRLLVRGGLAQEALLLARPLLTDSLGLQELASADDQRRVELVNRWELATLAALDGVWIEGRAQGRDVDEVLELQGKRRAELQAHSAREGLSTKHWMPDRYAKSLARKHGRQDEYLDLLVLHQFIHGSHFVTAQRYRIPSERVMLIGGDAADQDVWASVAALSAAQSVLYAARAACTFLRIDEPSELVPLLAQVEAMAPPEPSSADAPPAPG